jgi:hypothetical protein
MGRKLDDDQGVTAAAEWKFHFTGFILKRPVAWFGVAKAL